jgi:hypothetical protein
VDKFSCHALAVTLSQVGGKAQTCAEPPSNRQHNRSTSNQPYFANDVLATKAARLRALKRSQLDRIILSSGAVVLGHLPHLTQPSGPRPARAGLFTAVWDFLSFQQLSNCHRPSMNVHVLGCIALAGALGSLSIETTCAEEPLTRAVALS